MTDPLVRTFENTALPAGSVARGIAAGALTLVISIPVVPVVWLGCAMMKRVLYHKVMHREMTLDELHRHGAGTLMTNMLVGGATGLIAAGLAAWAALALVKHGSRWAFLGTAWTGFLLGTVLAWHGATAHGDSSGSAPMAVVAFLLLAMAGSGLAEAATTMPDPRAARRG